MCVHANMKVLPENHKGRQKITQNTNLAYKHRQNSVDSNVIIYSKIDSFSCQDHAMISIFEACASFISTTAVTIKSWFDESYKLHLRTQLLFSINVTECYVFSFNIVFNASCS